MKSKDFVEGIKNQLLAPNVASYRSIYENPRKVTEEVLLFQSLTNEQKEVFFKIVRQVQIDTIATFLSLLDGAIVLEDQRDDFRLVCLDEPSEILNRNLTDEFLNTMNE